MDRKTYTVDLTLVSDSDLPPDAEIVDLVTDQMNGTLDEDGLECASVLLRGSRVSTFTEPTNKSRASDAIDGLEPYAHKTGMVAEFNAASQRAPEATLEESRDAFLTVAGDFLADLFHAARDLGVDYELLVSRAASHFEDEVYEEEGGRD